MAKKESRIAKQVEKGRAEKKQPVTRKREGADSAHKGNKVGAVMVVGGGIAGMQ